MLWQLRVFGPGTFGRSTKKSMRTVAQHTCPICGSSGIEEYSALRDSMYETPGSWHMKRCTRTSCGAFWLDPTPHPEDLPLAYQGYYTHKAGAGISNSLGDRVRDALISRRLGYPHRQNLTFRLASQLFRFSPSRAEFALHNYFYLPWRKSGRVLEVGCGAGDQLLALKNAGWDVLGIDFDPAAVATANARGLDVRLGDLRQASLPEASFDAIVMSHVVEHVIDPVGLLKECARILKPRGDFVAITPNASSWGHRKFRESWRGLEPPRHLTIFTPRALRLAIEKAGLTPTRTRYSARDAANLLFSSAKIRKLSPGARLALQSEKRPPGSLRTMEMIERVSGWMRMDLAEEQVQFATK
jgi:SAM-dependent methyltransferase